MNANDAERLPDISGWEVFSLQISAFPVVHSIGYGPGWWKALLGTEPDESVKKRGEMEDKGQVNQCTLSLKVEINRITWTVLPPADPLGLPSLAMPTAGGFIERSNWFQGLISNWLRSSPLPFKRIAFACSLIRNTDGHKAGYQLLEKYLRGNVKIDPSSSDFLYRVNRKRPSQTVSGLLINRMSSWSVRRFSVQILEHIPTAVQQPAPQQLQEVLYGCGVDIDVNSHQERLDEIPAEKLIDLLQELRNLAQEIADQGDIP